MGISTSRLCDRRAYRGRIDGEYRMRAPSVASRSRTRGWRTATGPMPVMISRSGRWPWRTSCWPVSVLIGMLCEKLSNLRLDRLGQQRTRAAAQDLCEGIGKGPWLGELDDVTVRHGVSLLHWRSGGVEHHHDTPPYPVTPSPTSGHSSSEFAFVRRIAKLFTSWSDTTATRIAGAPSWVASIRRADCFPIPEIAGRESRAPDLPSLSSTQPFGATTRV